MIVISGALVLVALVLLIIGVVGDMLNFVYGSIAVSVLALVFLGIGILQRRGEPAPAAAEGEDEPDAKQVAAAESKQPNAEARREATPQAAQSQDDEPDENEDEDDDEPEDDASQDAEVGVPAVEDTVDADVEYGGAVLVVSGRPRYHVEGCRYLTGRDAEQIDALDARDEGFTPCGVCKPDEVLRAEYEEEYGEVDPEDDDVEVIDETEGPDDEAEDDEPEPEPAEVTTAMRRQPAPVASSRRTAQAAPTGRREAVMPPGPAKTGAAGEPDAATRRMPAAGTPASKKAVGARAEKEPSPPRTQEPRTQAPRTQAPRTQAPRTQAPRTQEPRTQGPSKQALTKQALSTHRATTAAARSSAVTTSATPSAVASRPSASTDPARTAAATRAGARPPAASARPSAAPARPAAAGRGGASPAARTSSRAAVLAAQGTPAAATAAKTGSVVVIPDRGRYHRSECRYVRGVAGAEVLTKAQAARQGYEPCGVCKP